MAPGTALEEHPVGFDELRLVCAGRSRHFWLLSLTAQRFLTSRRRECPAKAEEVLSDGNDGRAAVDHRSPRLSKDIELVRKEQESGKDKVGAASPWYVKWAGILGVPALVFVMMVNWSQANLNSGSTEKTQAETQKIRVDTLKTRADLQQQLDTLQKSRAADINTPGLNETLANIKSTIADIQRLRESEVKGALTNIVMRFVIVWFALQASGLAIGIFSRLWNTVFVSSFVLFNQTSGDRSIGKFIKTIAPILIMILEFVPTVVSWYVTIFILFTASQPIAYDAAIVIGRQQQFTDMTAAARDWEFSKVASNFVACSVEIPPRSRRSVGPPVSCDVFAWRLMQKSRNSARNLCMPIK